MFATLDSPPWLVTKVAARIFDQPALLFWLFFGLPLGILSVVYGISLADRVSVALHRGPKASETLMIAVIFALLFTFTFIPRVVGVYANRRASARALLIGGLAARPPRVAGGAHRCRICGAPLERHEGATVARCLYCHADNAIRVRTVLVEKTREVVERVERTIGEAFDRDRRERAQTRRILLSELLRYLAWTCVFGALFATYVWDDARNKTAGEPQKMTALGKFCVVAIGSLLIALPIVALERLHVFESRSSTFADDDVLQENVIVTATKGVPQADVTISSSEAGSLQPTMSRQVPFASVVRPSDPQRFIHVASEADADGIASKMEALTVKLPDLGLAVSTGRVVDFRAREYLRMQPTPGAGPLIYPTHFAEGVVRWPKESKKPNALLDVPETEPLWFPSGWYVLVKRFSSKEERRRVVACVFDPEVVRGPRVAFENHVNVFHEEGAGLPREVARGLALFLNSTIVDRYLRQFSGHTQVNATDLRSLKYPSRNALAVMGKKFATVSEQREIDDLVERALAPVWAA